MRPVYHGRMPSYEVVMDGTDARRRWTILALLFAARVGLGFQFQAMGSVGDAVASRLQLSFAEVGTLIGLFLAPGLVLAIPAGMAGRYASDRVLVALGMACLALGGILAAVADGFALLALGRLLSGAGFVVSTLYLTKMTADWFAGRELATAMAILVMSWPFGIAMGQVGHGWLEACQGWRWPFAVASAYCLAGALAVLIAYRPPPRTAGAGPAPSLRLTGREWTLTLIASLVWAAFNAGYVVYLSFAPRVLVAGGLSPLGAASIVSLASWVMIVSGAVCGQIADRTGRADLVLYVCMAGAVASLVLLPQVGWAIPLSLAFGLVGMAPAGVIMALTGAAMAPEKRAFGMGVFLSAYFLLTAPAPAVAGWLFDRTGDPFLPILLAAALFALTAVANVAFRIAAARPRPGWPVS
jgi:predicted MFS family arabinose efflux permease